jgi:Fic family protein
MIVLKYENPDLYDRLQEKNLIRQYDLLTTSIEIGLQQGPTSFDKYLLWALNHVAVAGLSQFGGRFRQEPIYVGNHLPPHFREVPDLMDRFVSVIHENWYLWTPTFLASYALWRLNWIHPFIEGNGRTARAACYYLLCARSNVLFGGKKIVPERIRENREPYIAALRASDAAWDAGHLDLASMTNYLAQLLQAQLTEPREAEES